ncbi:MAG: methyltransferase domain-containing protein [Ignavibacteriae bacterium]|nr:methyltransferase domain-containing protein [Ignavibacteriota bacterium]
MTNYVYVPNKQIMQNSVELRDDYNKFVREVKRSQHAIQDMRIVLSEKYLNGRGIEIGAFHAPVPLKEGCSADYVDKVDIDTLKRWMPETKEQYCIYPTVIEDGEKLSSLPSNSYDFLIANHMLEHTENVFRTIENHIRVVKENGFIFYALPDKRYTFDKDRELTPYEHLKFEYYNGPEKHRIEHYKEFGRIVSKVTDEALLELYVKNHLDENRDIHFHVWQYNTFLDQILKWIDETNLNIELVEHSQNGIEFIMIFRKLSQIDIAEVLIEKGKLDEAKKILQNELEKNNENLEIQNDLAVISIMEQKFIEAEEIIKSVLNKDSTNEIALNNLKFLNEVLH